MQSQGRRQFVFDVGLVSAAALMSPTELAWTENWSMRSSRLSVLANRTAESEGRWALRNIEGQVPLDLMGRLVRNGPGQKDAFGHGFKHFFDGDAYISCFKFIDGEVELTSKFINTPERLEEQSSQKMLYHEFGTVAQPELAKGFKNPPNINIMPWQNEYLAFAESTRPTRLDKNFEYLGLWTGGGQLPENITFTAHPKVDPLNGFIYAYGYAQNITRALKVFRLDPWSGEIKELWSLPQNQVYMIHDMALTKDHIVFVIPPAYFSIVDLAMGNAPISKSLNFSKASPTRVLVLRKDGAGMPQEFLLPPQMVYHTANAFIEGDILTIDAFTADDNSFINFMSDWEQLAGRKINYPNLIRYEVDMTSKDAWTKKILHERADFPAFNEDYRGQKNNYIYFAEFSDSNDPLAFKSCVKMDLRDGQKLKIDGGENEVFGEPVFVPRIPCIREDDGYLLFMGYNNLRDESFLEIRRSTNMSFVSRIWADRYLPLGFHGSFVRN